MQCFLRMESTVFDRGLCAVPAEVRLYLLFFFFLINLKALWVRKVSRISCSVWRGSVSALEFMKRNILQSPASSQDIWRIELHLCSINRMLALTFIHVYCFNTSSSFDIFANRKHSFPPSDHPSHAEETSQEILE